MLFYTVDYTIRILEIIVKINKKNYSICYCKVSDFEHVFFSLRLTLKFKYLKENRLKTESHFLKIEDATEPN